MLRCFWFNAGPGIWRSSWISTGRARHGCSESCSVSPLQYMLQLLKCCFPESSENGQGDANSQKQNIKRNDSWQLVASWPVVRNQSMDVDGLGRWNSQSPIRWTRHGNPGNLKTPVPRRAKWKTAVEAVAEWKFCSTAAANRFYMILSSHLFIHVYSCNRQDVAMNSLFFLICLCYTQLKNSQIWIRHGVKMALVEVMRIFILYIIVPKLSNPVCFVEIVWNYNKLCQCCTRHGNT